MKTFNQVCAQGDVMFTKVDSLPEGVVEQSPENGKLIVTHSETGHHHVMDPVKTKMYTLPNDIMKCFLVVEGDGDVLEHLRSNDTHEAIGFGPGIYRVNRQREHTPQGYRRIAD